MRRITVRKSEEQASGSIYSTPVYKRLVKKYGAEAAQDMLDLSNLAYNKQIEVYNRKIATLQEKVDSLERRLGNNGGTAVPRIKIKPKSYSTDTIERTCPKCNSPVDRDSEFCVVCGADFQKGPDIVEGQTIRVNSVYRSHPENNSKPNTVISEMYSSKSRSHKRKGKKK